MAFSLDWLACETRNYGTLNCESLTADARLLTCKSPVDCLLHEFMNSIIP